jgi:hypothetical protein
MSIPSRKGSSRNGLNASAWYQVVKWEALALDARGGRVRSSPAARGRNKRKMIRTSRRPPAPGLGTDEDPATRRGCWGRLTAPVAGQILLPNAVCCAEEPSAVGRSLQAPTATACRRALFERVVESSSAAAAVLAAQQHVIRESFHGRKSAYVAALHQAHATVGIALSVLGDELRRARLEQPRYAPKPTGGEVSAFYSAYPDLLVRRVRVTPAPPWLAARTGFAVEESAPQQLFSLPAGRKSRLSTLLGSFAVKPLGPAQPLGALPLPTVRSAIVAALRGFERAQSFEHWTIAQQNHALNRTICLRDQLPQPAAIDLTEYLPFLRIQ